MFVNNVHPHKERDDANRKEQYKQKKTTAPNVMYTVPVLPSSPIRSIGVDGPVGVPYRTVRVGGARDIAIDTPHAWQKRAPCVNAAPQCVQNFFSGIIAPESRAKLIFRSKDSLQK